MVHIVINADPMCVQSRVYSIGDILLAEAYITKVFEGGKSPYLVYFSPSNILQIYSMNNLP